MGIGSDIGLRKGNIYVMTSDNSYQMTTVDTTVNGEIISRVLMIYGKR